MRLFILAAIVLIVFGIIAAASASLELFSTAWYVWFMASFLAYLTDLAIGGLVLTNGAFPEGTAESLPRR